jgi:AAA15 family ATPase/GTPase
MEETTNTNNTIKQASPIIMPSFTLEKIPYVRIKSLSFINYKVFENYTFNFYDEDGIKDFICFIGSNGIGKSTVLNAIQLLFSRIEGREIEKIRANLGKSVRHTKRENTAGVYGDADFLLTAQITSSVGDYEIQINKNGFVKDHPEEIKDILYRLIYSARFDQELNQFQLAREKWPIFKELFESVTGFKIEEKEEIANIWEASNDFTLKNLIKNYVLSFYIKKPHETISEREASAGERKIIKSFSTLLTLEYTPQIILVDNIEMHVERKRHMALIESMQKCFPKSQIFSTTHSYYISRLMDKNTGVEDLRLIWANNFIKANHWRLKVIDEIDDSLIKLMSFKKEEKTEQLIQTGEKILFSCYGDIKDLQLFKEELEKFLKGVSEIFVTNVLP